MRKIVGEIGQLGGLFAGIAGIAIEIVYEAHIGIILVSTCCLAWGFFTKIRHDESFLSWLFRSKKSKQSKRKKK